MFPKYPNTTSNFKTILLVACMQISQMQLSSTSLEFEGLKKENNLQ